MLITLQEVIVKNNIVIVFIRKRWVTAIQKMLTVPMTSHFILKFTLPPETPRFSSRICTSNAARGAEIEQKIHHLTNRRAVVRRVRLFSCSAKFEVTINMASSILCLVSAAATFTLWVDEPTIRYGVYQVARFPRRVACHRPFRRTSQVHADNIHHLLRTSVRPSNRHHYSTNRTSFHRNSQVLWDTENRLQEFHKSQLQQCCQRSQFQQPTSPRTNVKTHTKALCSV